jgi:hypothetical protein
MYCATQDVMSKNAKCYKGAKDSLKMLVVMMMHLCQWQHNQLSDNPTMVININLKTVGSLMMFLK